MESTSIAVERTIADIEKCLSKYGVTAMLKEYTGGEIESLSFKIKRGQVDIPIQLPCRWIAIFEFLRKRSRMSDWSLANDRSPTNQKRIKNLQLKARQVAWRQVFRWVQAQLAMVDTEMVTVDEVFFPYIQTRNGQTVYELHKNNLLQLGSGNNS